MANTLPAASNALTATSLFVEEVFATTEDSEPDPKNHRHAMSLPSAAKWRQSQIKEYMAHVENKTFGPATRLPPGFKAIPCSWVFHTKRNLDKKGRVVIRGFYMLPGVDFNETFAPVARISSIRIILAIATKRNLELTQLDIKTAFLSADMDTEVYVTLPPRFSNNPSLNFPNKNSRTVHRLLKGVPGILQGTYLFNKKIHKIFISLGFVCSFGR
jgi:hypothetical protein